MISHIRTCGWYKTFIEKLLVAIILSLSDNLIFGKIEYGTNGDGDNDGNYPN